MGPNPDLRGDSLAISRLSHGMGQAICGSTKRGLEFCFKYLSNQEFFKDSLHKISYLISSGGGGGGGSSNTDNKYVRNHSIKACQNFCVSNTK